MEEVGTSFAVGVTAFKECKDEFSRPIVILKKRNSVVELEMQMHLIGLSFTQAIRIPSLGF
jgi:hypothetical protein